LALPMELIRPGRVDLWWWVDLPDERERTDVFNVVIRKFGRNIEKFDLPELVAASVKMSGAEIENAFKDAMVVSFYQKKEVNQAHVMEQLAKVIPQATINEAQISAMREKVDGRLCRASLSNLPAPATVKSGRKITA